MMTKRSLSPVMFAARVFPVTKKARLQLDGLATGLVTRETIISLRRMFSTAALQFLNAIGPFAKLATITMSLNRLAKIMDFLLK